MSYVVNLGCKPRPETGKKNLVANRKITASREVGHLWVLTDGYRWLAHHWTQSATWFATIIQVCIPTGNYTYGIIQVSVR